jgi:hypothetical protein
MYRKKSHGLTVTTEGRNPSIVTLQENGKNPNLAVSQPAIIRPAPPPAPPPAKK